MHQLETKNTKLLWNLSNKRVVLGLYDAYKQAQVFTGCYTLNCSPDKTSMIQYYIFVGLFSIVIFA